ncbi:hypothetical protein Tco_0375805 [Tanacetum coccineum]
MASIQISNDIKNGGKMEELVTKHHPLMKIEREFIRKRGRRRGGRRGKRRVGKEGIEGGIRNGVNSESSGYVASENEVESDLESTTRSEPECKEMEDTCESGIRPNPDSSKAVPTYMLPDYPSCFMF